MHKLVHGTALTRRLIASCFALAAFSAPAFALAHGHSHGSTHAKTVAMRNCDDGGYANCSW